MKFDFGLFNDYNIDHRVTDGTHYIRPLWKNTKGQNFKRWVNIDTPTAKQYLSQATNGDIGQLYQIQKPKLSNVIAEFSYHEDVFDSVDSGQKLRDLIEPLINGKRLVMNIQLDGRFKRFISASTITDKTPRGKYYEMADTLSRIVFDADYHDGSDIILSELWETRWTGYLVHHIRKYFDAQTKFRCHFRNLFV